METQNASTHGRPLRRTERGLTEEQAYEVIRGTDHATLGTCDRAGNPYCIPITPVLVGKALYFHSTRLPGGRKADNMLMNPRVCVCFTGKAITVPLLYTVDFASAVVSGTAHQVTDDKEKESAMRTLLARHAPGNSQARNALQLEVRLPAVEVWRIDIESVTGKARAAARWQPGVTLTTPAEMPTQPWLVNAPK